MPRSFELRSRLDPQVLAIEEKRAEAQRLLDQADAERRELQRMFSWLRRSAGPGLLVAWGSTPTPQPEKPLDLLNILGHGGVISHA